MFDTWGMDLHGGTHYKGMCPICEKSNGDVFNYPHEECVASQPKICPSCLLPKNTEEFTHGMCGYCYQMELEENSVINNLKPQLK